MASLVFVSVIHTPVTETSFAFGANNLKTILLSGNISGDFGSTGLDIIVLDPDTVASDGGLSFCAATETETRDTHKPVKTVLNKQSLMFIMFLWMLCGY
jgi:hypothetical protein